MKIFYKKSTAIAFTVAILVLVLLVCMLLVSLTQMAHLGQEAKNLKELIDKAQSDVQAKEQLLAQKNDIQGIIKWAEEHGYINQDDINWVRDNLK